MSIPVKPAYKKNKSFAVPPDILLIAKLKDKTIATWAIIKMKNIYLLNIVYLDL